MNTMKRMPGFTAEASLRDVDARYRTSKTKVDVGGGLIQPAFEQVYKPRPLYCMSALECRPTKSWPWLVCSNTGFGIWNPVTHRCERF